MTPEQFNALMAAIDAKLNTEYVKVHGTREEQTYAIKCEVQARNQAFRLLVDEGAR